MYTSNTYAYIFIRKEKKKQNEIKIAYNKYNVIANILSTDLFRVWI